MATIASLNEVLTVLGIFGTATAQQLALAQLVHPAAEAACKDILLYDPVQQTHTEFYFPHSELGGPDDVHTNASEYITDVTATKVIWLGKRNPERLCLKNIPVRSITEIREDYDGQAGQGSGTFPSSSILTANTDYYLDLDSSGMCRSGFVYRGNSAWPITERAVKVTYVAGYTAQEFMTIASPIKMAVLFTVVRTYKAFAAQAAGAGLGGGGPGGALISETLDAYSYTIGDGDDPSNLAGFGINPVAAVPDNAQELLMPYIHYGRDLIN